MNCTRKSSQRPKLEDRVEFIFRKLSRVGVVVAVASTGVHYVVETFDVGNVRAYLTVDSEGFHKHRAKPRRLHIPLSRIVKILPKLDS